MLVATTGTADDGTPRSLLGIGQIDPHLCLVFRVAIVGTRTFRLQINLLRFLRASHY
jgi:hypothetical protein